jgi:large subunit ribosomal protein L3
MTGIRFPVTVLDVSNNRVAQIKTPETDGYAAVQVVIRSTSRFPREQGRCGSLRQSWRRSWHHAEGIPRRSRQAAGFKAGDAVNVSLFEVGQKIDVQGTSIGKGYAGTIKRHNFASGRQTHGNSRSHNVPGSIGMAQDPGRVFPGKRMTGHMGDVTVTTQNLEIARIDAERQLLLVKGAVPGAKNGQVIVKPAVKVKAQERSLSDGTQAPE